MDKQGRLVLRCAALDCMMKEILQNVSWQVVDLTIYDVSVCTVTRFVNANGLFYLQTRKKGLFKREHSKKEPLFQNITLEIIAETFRQTISPFIWMGHSLCK